MTTISWEYQIRWQRPNGSWTPWISEGTYTYDEGRNPQRRRRVAPTVPGPWEEVPEPHIYQATPGDGDTNYWCTCPRGYSHDWPTPAEHYLTKCRDSTDD